MDLVDVTYESTYNFPSEERFGLVSQMRRSAVSIPSNIAESSRRYGKDGKQLLIIAFGSGAELETQIEIAFRRKYMKKLEYTQATKLLDEVMRMLNVMINKE